MGHLLQSLVLLLVLGTVYPGVRGQDSASASFTPVPSASSVASASPSFTPMPSPSQGPTQSPTSSPAPLCMRCLLGSGQCQDESGTCYPYQLNGQCPTGSYACRCPLCVGGTGSLCHYPDYTCSGYVAGTNSCPAGSYQCYVNAPVAETPSVTRTRTPTPAASLGPACVRCGPGSSGPCQNIYAACWAYDGNGQCPSGTYECTCPTCKTGSGPCHYTDGTCGEYASGTVLCPSGSFECYVDSMNAPSTTKTASGTPSNSRAPSITPTLSVTRSETPTNTPSLSESGSQTESPSSTPSQAPYCRRCAAGTKGKCQEIESDKCYALRSRSTTRSRSPTPFSVDYVFEDGTCPNGSWQCVCPPCADGTSGACHFDDGTCVPHVVGTTQCPLDAFECYVDTLPTGSASPSESFTYSATRTRSPSKSWSSSKSATESETPSNSPTPTWDPMLLPLPARSSGLSAGAGFGLAIGICIIVVVGLLVAHLVYKKKQQRKELREAGGRSSSEESEDATQQLRQQSSRKPSKLSPKSGRFTGASRIPSFSRDSPKTRLNQIMPMTPNSHQDDSPSRAMLGTPPRHNNAKQDQKRSPTRYVTSPLNTHQPHRFEFEYDPRLSPTHNPQQRARQSPPSTKMHSPSPRARGIVTGEYNGSKLALVAQGPRPEVPMPIATRPLAGLAPSMEYYDPSAFRRTNSQSPPSESAFADYGYANGYMDSPSYDTAPVLSSAQLSPHRSMATLMVSPDHYGRQQLSTVYEGGSDRTSGAQSPRQAMHYTAQNMLEQFSKMKKGFGGAELAESVGVPGPPVMREYEPMFGNPDSQLHNARHW